jgi:transposase
MIPVPSGVRVWLAVGRTDMRRGMNGLALQVQEALGRDPHAGDLYVFRGARGDSIKVLPLTIDTQLRAGVLSS